MPTFGRTTTASSTAADWANYKFGTRYELTEAGTVSKVTAHLSNIASGHAACNVRAVIYADSSNAPAALVGQSQEVAIADNQALGWVDFALAFGLALTAGYYWLGLHAGTGAGGLAVGRDGTGSGRYNADTYSDGPADPFGSGTTWDYLTCVYATYEVGGGGATILIPRGIGSGLGVGVGRGIA